jgi:hypothetical protein
MWAGEEQGGEPWRYGDWSSPTEFRYEGVPRFNKLSNKLNSKFLVYVRLLGEIFNRSISEVLEEM